jgi:mono/diheme cytochrome c family protein
LYEKESNQKTHDIESGFDVHSLRGGLRLGCSDPGMPAWSGLLSDEEIWQILSLLKNSQDLPSSVEAQWNER